MKRLRAYFECPICKNKNEVTFRKPDSFTNTIGRAQCCHCGSVFQVVAKHIKHEKGKVNLTVIKLHEGERHGA